MPTRPDLVVLLNVLSLSAGTGMSIMLIVLARRSALRWPGALLMVRCSLLWNVAGLIAETQMLLGVPAQAWTHSVAVALQSCAGALFPISFIAAWSFPKFADARRRRIARWLHLIAIVNAAVIGFVIVGCIVSGWLPHVAKLCVPCSEAVLLTAASITLVAGRLKTAADRIYLTLSLLGSWLAAAGMFALEFWKLPPMAFQAACLIASEAPFLIIIGALFFFARFRSADVLINKSLRVVGALSVAFSGSFAVVFAYRIGGQVLNPPEVGRAVAVIATLFGLLVLFEWIDSVLNRAAERWILREPDYQSELRGLWDRIVGLDSPDQIFSAVEQALPRFLDVAAVRVVECHHQRTFGAQPWEVAPGDPCRDAIPGFDVDLIVPVRLRGEVPHMIAIAPGSCRRILLTKDLHFLQDVAIQISQRLESLAGERDRVERQSREASLKHLAAVAELKALRAQINPHFLFNSLNTIADLIVCDPAKAETMTVLLASVFRHVLLHSDGHLTPIADEVSFLRTYLRIEEVRFGDRLLVDVDIESAVEQHRIPSLLLQPIVENAIKHGLAPKIGQGRLRISAQAEGDFTRLEVEDDGVGLGGEPQGVGVGLKNVADRLRMLYDGRARLTCENATLSGTLVTILIPNSPA